MSWKAENWLAENCDLAFGVPRALLFAMANQANDEGSLMAKNGTYMKRLNVTERSVQRATASLVKGGWIEKIPDYSEDGRQLCNVYRIVMPSKVGGGRVTPASPPQGDSPVTLPVTPSVTPRVTSAVTPIKNQTDKPYGETTETTTAPPTPRGQEPVNSAQAVPWEDVEALRQNITEIAEWSGVGFDTVCLQVTSGATTRKSARCLPTLNLERMGREHVRRSLADTRTVLARLREGAA